MELQNIFNSTTKNTQDAIDAFEVKYGRIPNEFLAETLLYVLHREISYFSRNLG